LPFSPISSKSLSLENSPNLLYFSSVRLSGGDSYCIDILSGVTLWSICYRTYHFRDEIRFGPYSIARKSASKLINFAFIQASFSTIDLILATVERYSDCPEQPSSQSQLIYCVSLGFLGLMFHQCWIWYAILCNWRMVFTSQGPENEGETEGSTVSFSGPTTSTKPSAFLSSDL